MSIGMKQNQYLSFLKPIFLAVALSTSSTSTYAQVLEEDLRNNKNNDFPFLNFDINQQLRHDAIYTDHDKNIHTQRVSQVFIRNPHLYKIALDAYQRPTYDALERVRQKIKSRQSEMESAIKSATISGEIGVTGSAGIGISGSGLPIKADALATIGGKVVKDFYNPDQAVYDLKNKRALADIETRSDIFRDIDTFKAVSEKFTDIEYKLANGEQLSDPDQIIYLVGNELKTQSKYMPPEAGKAEALILTSPETKNLINSLNLESDKPEKNIEKLTQYQIEIVVKFVNQSQEIKSSLVPPKNDNNELGASAVRTKELSQKQINLQKLKVHDAAVQELRDTFSAINQAALLFLPNADEILRASAFIEGSIQVADAIVEMKLGEINPKSISSLLSGLGMIANSQKRGPTAEEVMLEMLEHIIDTLHDVRKHVLENGQKMTTQISMIDEIQDTLKIMQQTQKYRFDMLGSQISIYYNSQRERDQNFAQKELISKLTVDADSAIGNVTSKTGQIRSEYFDCLRKVDINKCSVNSVIMHNNVLQAFSKIYRTAYKTLRDPTDQRFQTRKNMFNFTGEQEIETFSDDISDRVGELLPSMGQWINEKSDEFGISGKNKVDIANLSFIPHPESTQELISGYIRLRPLVHPSELYEISAKQVYRLQELNETIALASQEMRMTISNAQKVYVRLLKDFEKKVSPKKALAHLAKKYRIASLPQINELSQEEAKKLDDSNNSAGMLKVLKSLVHMEISRAQHREIDYHKSENNLPFSEYPLSSHLILLEKLDGHQLFALGNHFGILQSRYIHRNQSNEFFTQKRGGNTYRSKADSYVFELSRKGIDLANKLDLPTDVNYTTFKVYADRLNPPPALMYAKLSQKDNDTARQVFLLLVKKHLHDSHDKMMSSYRGGLEGLPDYTEIAKARLIIDTFIQASYGEAYWHDDYLDDFRSMSRLMSEIDSIMDELKHSASVHDLYESYMQLYPKITEIGNLDLNITVPLNRSLSIGFDRVDESREALNEIENSFNILEN
jgi:hypothetical protein